MAVLQSSEINWYQQDCPGWYGYDYLNADVRDMPATHRGDHKYPGSNSRVREGVKVVNLIDVQSKFEERVKER